MIEKVFLVFVALIGIYKYFFSGKQTTQPINSTPSRFNELWGKFKNLNWPKQWLKENWKEVLGFAGLHIITVYLFPKQWLWLASQPMFWADQIVVGLAFALREETKGRKPKKVFTTFWKAILLVLFLGNFPFIGKILKEKEFWTWNEIEIPSQNQTVPQQKVEKPKIALPVNEEGCKVVLSFFKERESELPRGVSPELITEVSRRESGCNHFFPGTTTVLTNDGLNTNGTIDVGIMQINNSWISKLPSIINIFDMGGNLEATLHIIKKKKGMEDWVTYEPALVALKKKTEVVIQTQEATLKPPDAQQNYLSVPSTQTPTDSDVPKGYYTVMAPVGEWSEEVKVGLRFHTMANEDYKFLTDYGQVGIDGPGRNVQAKRLVRSVRFQSLSDRPTKIFVKK